MIRQWEGAASCENKLQIVKSYIHVELSHYQKSVPSKFREQRFNTFKLGYHVAKQLRQVIISNKQLQRCYVIKKLFWVDWLFS